MIIQDLLNIVTSGLHRAGPFWHGGPRTREASPMASMTSNRTAGRGTRSHGAPGAGYSLEIGTLTKPNDTRMHSVVATMAILTLAGVASTARAQVPVATYGATQPVYTRPTTGYVVMRPAYNTQPVIYVQQPVTYVQQPVTYVQQPAVAQPVTYSQPAAPPAYGDAYGFTGWLNSIRAQYGLPGVAYDGNLESWAAANNAQQSARGMGHFVMGPARRQNSAIGTAASIGAQWLASPAHRAALLDPSITRIGLAGLGSYWTFNAY